ncbi:hypothetical protein N7527_000199 [Penicillium freii]|nr:hypothetical protein N7527_000199 [Penicillium freii]
MTAATKPKFAVELCYSPHDLVMTYDSRGGDWTALEVINDPDRCPSGVQSNSLTTSDNHGMTGEYAALIRFIYL